MMTFPMTVWFGLVFVDAAFEKKDIDQLQILKRELEYLARISRTTGLHVQTLFEYRGMFVLVTVLHNKAEIEESETNQLEMLVKVELDRLIAQKLKAAS